MASGAIARVNAFDTSINRVAAARTIEGAASSLHKFGVRVQHRKHSICPEPLPPQLRFGEANSFPFSSHKLDKVSDNRKFLIIMA